jgi:outer membrane protein assembly factor BamB
VAGGTVYIGSYDHKVYALDAATGHLRWAYTTGGSVLSSPAVAGGMIYIGSADRKVYALSVGS